MVTAILTFNLCIFVFTSFQVNEKDFYQNEVLKGTFCIQGLERGQQVYYRQMLETWFLLLEVFKVY